MTFVLKGGLLYSGSGLIENIRPISTTGDNRAILRSGVKPMIMKGRMCEARCLDFMKVTQEVQISTLLINFLLFSYVDHVQWRT